MLFCLPMKPIVALLLSVLVLASSLLPRHDLAELGRLPRLLEHYRQHRQATEALSFAEFMMLHYGDAGSQSHDDTRSDEHEGLPLHDCHHAPVPVICVLPVLVQVPTTAFCAWPTLAYRPADSPRYPGGHAPTRWQPPCA